MRPKSAQTYSYKKITEILQNKYLSYQDKNPAKINNNLCPREHKKNKLIVVRPYSCRKSSRDSLNNIGIGSQTPVGIVSQISSARHNGGSLKENAQSINFLDIEKINLVPEQKEPSFVPYGQQAHLYPSVSMPKFSKPPRPATSIPIKSSKMR